MTNVSHPPVRLSHAGILVGGQSRRMGRPKASLPHPSGCSLLEYVVSVTSAVSSDVCLLGSPNVVPPGLRDFPVLEDSKPDAGPLAGLLSLLTLADDQWVFLCACDMPHITSEIVTHLVNNTSSDLDAVAYRRNGGSDTFHSTCALYHSRIRSAVVWELENGRGSIQAVLKRVRLAGINPSEHQVRQLTNVNTPEDFAQLSRS